MKKKIKLAVDGKFVSNFESIKVEQSIYDHHKFTAVIDHDLVEDQGSFTLNNSKDWLGKSVLISFDDYDFVGYIQKIRMINTGGGHNGDLELSGYSSTIRLEGNPHIQSFLEQDLQTIVEKTIKGSGLNLKYHADYKEKVPYIVQYNESHYHFLRRIARDFNQWLYYDGSNLVFGFPNEYNPIKLEYGSDLLNIELAIQTKPTNYNLQGYNAENHDSFQGDNQGDVKGLNDLGYSAWEASKGFYPNEAKGYTPAYVNTKIQSNFQRDRLEKALAAEMHILKATSENTNLQIGRTIDVRSARFEDYLMGLMNFKQENYGEYLITKITHYAQANGVYRNEFEALPGGITVLPLPENVMSPMAQPQLAEVVSHQDPEGKGRVQVKFSWMQGTTALSPYIRVMTPDAGSSSNHSQNRGQMFIPEVGDQVMIGFEHNDPSKPFVMGSMYHGNNHGANIENNIKSIITKSGHVIQFDDTTGTENITITDKNKNKIFLDTANSSIEISAPSSINIISKEINIFGEDKVHIESKDITLLGTDKISQESNSLIESKSPKITSLSDTTAINAKQTIDIEAQQITNVKGTTAVNLN